VGKREDAQREQEEETGKEGKKYDSLPEFESYT
jgi:hypothetical protein